MSVAAESIYVICDKTNTALQAAYNPFAAQSAMQALVRANHQFHENTIFSFNYDLNTIAVDLSKASNMLVARYADAQNNSIELSRIMVVDYSNMVWWNNFVKEVKPREFFYAIRAVPVAQYSKRKLPIGAAYMAAAYMNNDDKATLKSTTPPPVVLSSSPHTMASVIKELQDHFEKNKNLVSYDEEDNDEKEGETVM